MDYTGKDDIAGLGAVNQEHRKGRVNLPYKQTIR
jgi:hypothetical protein